MVNDILQPLRTPAATCQHPIIELFAEDAPTTQNGITPESTRHDCQFNSPTAEGQVSGPP
ncbi:hypothetical protein ASD54_21920 [Rhizobium sp. Root149]|nr:hypothetical protein ASD54_21920 [Rhizobium sp. Root149]